MTVPLLKSRKTKELNRHYRECEKAGIPYAVFSPKKKYGHYTLDFLPARGEYRLLFKYGSTHRERVSAAIKGAFEETFRRWQMKRYPNFTFYFGCGEYTRLSKCPVGEEDGLHEAICAAVDAVLREAQT